MAVAQTNPLELKTVYAIAFDILQSEEFGLSKIVTDYHDGHLVSYATELISKCQKGEEVDRECWRDLKRESLKFVGSPIADCISRLASALRTPDRAISGLRDACEKAIEINVEDAKRKITTAMQYRIQSLLGQQKAK